MAGFAIGLLLLSLVTLLVRAGGDFNQHEMVVYGTRATLYAEAALREAALVVERKLATAAGRDELVLPSWSQFVQQVKTTTRGDLTAPATGPLFERSVLSFLRCARELAAGGGAELVDVRLELRAFRRLSTNSLGVDLTQPSAYWFDPTLDPTGASAQPPVEAYGGFAVLTATAGFNGPRIYLERKLQSSHLFKFMMSSPVAREFAFFCWGDTRGHAGQEEDLNEGGSLLVFGRRDGRVYLRGPYDLRPEGYPPPLCREDPMAPTAGGQRPDPRAAPGYLPPWHVDPDTLQSVKDYQWTDCWGMLPAPRAGVVELCGPILLRVLLPGELQVRPLRWTSLGSASCSGSSTEVVDRWADFRQGLSQAIGALAQGITCLGGVIVPLDMLNACWEAVLFGDTGMKIDQGQWWWTEPRRVHATQGAGDSVYPNYFSIVGATVPDSQGRVRISPFKGVLCQDRPDGATDSLAPPIGVFKQPPDMYDRLLQPGDLGAEGEAPQSNAKKYVVMPEGDAEVLMNRATHCGSPLCANSYAVSVDVEGQDPAQACQQIRSLGPDAIGLDDPSKFATYRMPFGLYWAPAQYADRAAALLGDIIGLGLAVAGGAVGRSFGGHHVSRIVGRVVAGAVVGWAVHSVADAVLSGWNQERPGGYGADQAPAANVHRFPPGYGLPVHTALRRYARLADYPGLFTHDRNPDLAPQPEYDLLVLDGPIFVEKLDHAKPLLYVGRGTIVTGDLDRPTLTAPIVARDLALFENDGAAEFFGVLGRQEEFLGHPERTADSDSLGIFVQGDEAQPWTQEAMLTFRTAPAFEKSYDYDHPAPVHASVVSLNGVRPEAAGQAVRIVGNLVCYYANRKNIPPGSKLEVLFRSGTDGQTCDLAGMSPVLSGYAGEAEDVRSPD